MSVTAKIHLTSKGRSHGFMEAICISQGCAFGWMNHGCTLTALENYEFVSKWKIRVVDAIQTQVVPEQCWV